MKKNRYPVMLLFTVIIFLPVAPVFSQNRMSFDKAIDDFAAKVAEQYSDNRAIAVTRFEADRPEITTYFIEKMSGRLKDKNFTVLERDQHNIENVLVPEIDFSEKGAYVNDEENMQLGLFTAANTVIYGRLRKVNSVTYLMTITWGVTERAEIKLSEQYDLLLDSTLERLTGDYPARLWTLGASVGSSFSRPLLIGTVHGTIAPFHHFFVEVGLDAGALSRMPDESYMSMVPFAHAAYFYPFENFGLYAGAGIAYMYSTIRYQDWRDSVLTRKITADGIIGVNIMDIIDISYTARTDFKGITNKFSVGYTYRFNKSQEKR